MSDRPRSNSRTTHLRPGRLDGPDGEVTPEPEAEQPYSPSVFSNGRARGFWILAACCVLLGLWWLLTR